jgi:hypothetical protein
MPDFYHFCMNVGCAQSLSGFVNLNASPDQKIHKIRISFAPDPAFWLADTIG